MGKVIYRTWPALEKKLKGKKPTEYQITTYKLHYHFVGHDKKPRMEIDPEYRMVKWYEKYREGSSFRVDDWDDFEDPNQVVYWHYNIKSDNSENFIDHLLEEAEVNNYDENLDVEWLRHIAAFYGVMRYPYHALQMISMYVAQIAPASSITNCHAFEGMDNLRILQRIAYRIAMLNKTHPELGFGQKDKERWEKDKMFQPLREVIEKALIVYDWGESFSTLNLVLKPLVDELFLVQFSKLCLMNGDHVLADMNGNFYLDTLRNYRWIKALAKFSIERNPNNEKVLENHVTKWAPKTIKALESFEPVFKDAPKPMDFAEVMNSLNETYHSFLVDCGLSGWER